MARRIGRLPTPWTVSTPHRPSGISFLSNFYDRQVLFTGIPAFPAAGNRRRVNLRKKTRERTRPCGASSDFSCLCSSRVSCFHRAALGARLHSFQPGKGEQSASCLRNPCGKSSIQAALRRGKFSIEMASVSVNCSFLPGCLRQCDQGKNGCRKTAHGKGPNPNADIRHSDSA